MFNNPRKWALWLGWITLAGAFVLLMAEGAWAQVPTPDTLGNTGDMLPTGALVAARPRDTTTLLDTTRRDTLPSARTLRLDSLKRNSDLKSRVKYRADDSLIIDLDAEDLYLYGNSQLDYEDINLKADRMRLHWTDVTLNAVGTPDTSGNVKGEPIFTQGGEVFHAERITYNFKTSRGKIVYGRSQQNNDHIIGEAIRRNDDESLYIQNGCLTSCDHPHPHFYFNARKLKVQPNKWAVTGPVNLVVLDVPLPIGLPFAWVPLKTGRKSGLIFPTFGEAAQRGFFFRDIGFYFGISDRFDLILKGDIFTNGSFRIEVNPRYAVRYKFKGDLNAQFSYQAFNQPGDPDYRVRTEFNVRWVHNQPISPTSNFSASVNIASADFLRFNTFDPVQITQNKLASSIQATKSFGRGQWNLAVGLTHNQDLRTRDVNVSLPSINLSRSRWQPLVRKRPVGAPRWYEDIGIDYNLNFLNQLSGKDSTLFGPDILNQMRFGMRQTINLNSPIKFFKKFVTFTPSFNYNEYWYGKTRERSFVGQFNQDSTSMRFDSTIVRDKYGFFTARDFSFSASLNTVIYSIAQLPGKRQAGLRMTSTPSLQYTYRPDFSTAFWGYYQKVVSFSGEDSIRTETLYNRFEQGILGSPGMGEQQRVGFALNNLIELRWLRKDKLNDTTAKRKDRFRKINLLDNLGISWGYNFAAREFQMENLNLDARTNILGVVNLNWRGSFDPYTAVPITDTAGNAIPNRWQRVNRYAVSDGLSLFRFSQSTFQLGFTLDSKRLLQNKKVKSIIDRRSARSRKEGYVPFSMPWSINVNYGFNYNNPGRELADGRLVHSLNFNGAVEFTPNWKMTFSSGYDLDTRKLTFTQFRLTRDLHCWSMSLQVTPFGQYRSYFFTLAAKSASLRDLKIQQQRNFQDRFQP